MRAGAYKAIGIIPARYASKRFPGKVLAPIGDKPMIQHVYERASRAGSLQQVLVATDDERIARAVKRFGGAWRMTNSGHATGSDRVAEVAREMDADFVVNIQGDEPFIDPGAIDLAVEHLSTHPDASVATLVRPCHSWEELRSPNTAKVVLDERGYALYFSRSVIPFYRDELPAETALKAHRYFLHIGLYVFRRPFLLEYTTFAPTALEQAEKLEQLRILERGYKIICAQTDYESICVDTPDDLERAQQKYRELSSVENGEN